MLSSYAALFPSLRKKADSRRFAELDVRAALGYARPRVDSQVGAARPLSTAKAA